MVNDTQQINGSATLVGQEVKVQVADEHNNIRQFIIDIYTWEELVKVPVRFGNGEPSLTKRLVEKEAEFPVEVRTV